MPKNHTNQFMFCKTWRNKTVASPFRPPCTHLSYVVRDFYPQNSNVTSVARGGVACILLQWLGRGGREGGWGRQLGLAGATFIGLLLIHRRQFTLTCRLQIASIRYTVNVLRYALSSALDNFHWPNWSPRSNVFNSKLERYTTISQ